MEAIQSSDPQSSGGRPESAEEIPLLTKGVDMVVFCIFLEGFCETFTHGKDCLTTDWSKVEEEDQAKAARIKKLAVANARVNAAMYQAAISNPDAVAVIVQHAQEDPIEKNAFKLYHMLIEKFTKKTDERVQALVNTLNDISAQANEEPQAMVGRFDGLCRAIRALDPAQLPTEINLIGVLKKAIKSQFSLLSANVKLAAVPWTLASLKEKINGWDLKDEQIMLGLPRTNAEKAHFSSSMEGAGQGKARNQNRNQKEPEGQNTRSGETRPDTICFNCNKKGHRAFECRSKPNGSFNELKRNFESGGNNSGGDKRGRGGDSGSTQNNNSGGNNFKKKTFPLKAAWKGGKFNQSKQAGKQNSKYGGGNNFMDDEGNFIARAHFNNERLSTAADRIGSERIERALATRVQEGYSYCIDSGSNTAVINHRAENSENLRNLNQPLIIETATPTGNLLVTQAYDVGEISGVRLCEDATASLLPPEIINNCGVSVHLFKTEERGAGSHVCMLTANEKHIGGGDVEFNYYARRQNKLFWLNETQFSDLAFRKGFPQAEFDRVQMESLERLSRPNRVVHEESSRANTAFHAPEGQSENTGVKNYEQMGLNGRSGKWHLQMDKTRVKAYVDVWSKVIRMTSVAPMEKDESEYHATERCYNTTPYGRRYAVNQVGRDPEYYQHLPLFTVEDQVAYEDHLDKAERDHPGPSASYHIGAGNFNGLDYREAEQRFFDKWKDPVGHARDIAAMDRKLDGFGPARPAFLYSSDSARIIARNQRAEEANARFFARRSPMNPRPAETRVLLDQEMTFLL